MHHFPLLFFAVLSFADIDKDLKYINNELWKDLAPGQWLQAGCGNVAPFILCRGVHVVEFKALGQNLPGTLPGTLKYGLPALEVLDLSHNNLGGFMPAMPDTLVELFLQENNLVGMLPPSMPTQLTRLDLSRNNFVGPLASAQLPENIEQCILADSTDLIASRTRVNCFECVPEDVNTLPPQCAVEYHNHPCSDPLTQFCNFRTMPPPPPAIGNATSSASSSTPPPSPSPPSAAATTTTTTPIGGHTVKFDEASSSAASSSSVWSSPLVIVGALVLLALLLGTVVLLIACVACRRRRRRRRSLHQGASPRVRRGSSAASAASARAVSSTSAASRGASRTSLRASQTAAIPAAASRRSRYQELELRRSRVSRHQPHYEDWRLRPTAAEAAAYDVAVLNSGDYDDATARFTTTTRAANAYDDTASPFHKSYPAFV